MSGTDEEKAKEARRRAMEMLGNARTVTQQIDRIQAYILETAAALETAQARAYVADKLAEEWRLNAVAMQDKRDAMAAERDRNETHAKRAENVAHELQATLKGERAALGVAQGERDEAREKLERARDLWAAYDGAESGSQAEMRACGELADLLGGWEP